jgi:hypothetical protein
LNLRCVSLFPGPHSSRWRNTAQHTAKMVQLCHTPSARADRTSMPSMFKPLSPDTIRFRCLSCHDDPAIADGPPRRNENLAADAAGKAQIGLYGCIATTPSSLPSTVLRSFPSATCCRTGNPAPPLAWPMRRRRSRQYGNHPGLRALPAGRKTLPGHSMA